MTKDGANKLFNAQNKLKSMDQIAGILRGSLKGLGDMQRSMALETMFGSDAVRAGNILFKEGAEGVRKFSQEMSKVTAIEVAKGKMDNAAGAVEQLKGAFETIQVVLGMAFLPTIKDAANAMSNFFTQNMPQIQAFSDRMKAGLKDIFAPFFDPKYQKLDFGDKLALSAQRGIEKMVAWINGPGADVLRSTTVTLAAVGTEVGIAVGGALIKGIGQALLAHPMAAAVTAFVLAAKVPGVGMAVAVGAAIAAGLTAEVVKGVNVALEYIKKLHEEQGKLRSTPFGRAVDTIKNTPKGKMPYKSGEMKPYTPTAGQRLNNFFMNILPGHATGLPHVPYDDYVARLHKGEAVLTASEANVWRKYGVASEYTPAVAKPSIVSTTNTTNTTSTTELKPAAPNVRIEPGAVVVNVNGAEEPYKLADKLTDVIGDRLFKKIYEAGVRGA